MRDLPALKDNTILELKELIKRKFPENESIQKEEFEIYDEDEFPISEDTSVQALPTKSKIQIFIE